MSFTRPGHSLRVFLSFRTELQVLGTSVVILLASFSAFSQGNAGRILGGVTDQSGGAVTGATVTIIDTQRNLTRTLTADNAGEYNAPNLLPGTYTVRAAFQGFKTAERSGIILEVNQDLRVDLTLQPGEQTERVTVTEALPLVETTNAELGGTLQSQIIDSLPLNGRNFENLLQLRPGVTIYPGGSGWSQSTNGMRAHDNLYMVNGVNASDPWMGQSVMNAVMAGGDAGTILSVDSIDEFKTQENPRAEYGWKPGSIVNVGIKSGTNSLHGTAFAFGRETALDARNYFDQPPATKAPLSLEQFGGTVGGHLKKDKLFYFADFEGQRYSIGNPAQHNFPVTTSIGSTRNSLIDACLAAAKGTTAATRLTALSAELAGLSFNQATLGTPTPTGNCIPVPGQPSNGFQGLFPVNPGPGTAVSTAEPSTNTVNGGLIKTDYHLNDRHSFEGMYFISQGDALAVDAPTTQILSNFLSQEHARSQTASGSWTWVPTSSWVNEARVGYAHYYQSFLSNDHTVNPAAYTFNGSTYVMPTGITNPFYFGMPAINTGFGGSRNGIGAGWPKIVGPDGVLQFLDHISYLKGKHAFKFGGEVLYNRSGEDVTANGKGPVNFSGAGGKGLINFFTGNLSSANLFTGDPARTLSDTGYAVFLQDDWRVRPRLTVNAGIRYELTTVMKDAHNGLGNFDPNLGLVQVGQQISGPYRGDHNNFAPRLGFAWDVAGNGKTVVRAGAGIIYESQISFDVTNGIGNLLGLRTIPTGLPLYNNGSTTPLPSQGNITTASTAYTGGALTPIKNAWRAFDPTQPISATNASLYAAAASPACGDGLTPIPGFPKPPSPCSIVGIDPNIRTPYVENWNLDVQRALGSNLSLDVGYVGNHGAKLLGKLDINQAQPGAGWNTPFNATTAAAAGLPTTGALSAVGLSSAQYCINTGSCVVNALAEQASRPFTAPCAGSIAGLGAVNGSGASFNPNNSCFSFLKNVAIINNGYTSNYDGLQATLTARNYHGLTLTAGYTYSHALGEASDQGTSGNFPIPLNSYGNVRSQLYASSDFDIRHRGTFSLNYTFPGKKGFGQMLEGWSANSIVLIQSGSGWGLADVTDDFSGTSEAISNGANSQGEQWDFFGNPADFTPVHGWTDTNLAGGSFQGGLPYFAGTTNAACLAKATALGPLAVASLTSLGCYAVGSSVLIPPAYGSYGTTPRNLWRDAGFRDWDLSVTKAFKFNERLSAQFRAEFFNILNRPIFANPTGGPGGGAGDPSAGIGFGTQNATPDVLSSNPELGSGGPRSIQLGLKLIF
jgi:Carboxypeptidase regulatory-like domain/TonB dependent receptor